MATPLAPAAKGTGGGPAVSGGSSEGMSSLSGGSSGESGSSSPAITSAIQKQPSSAISLMTTAEKTLEGGTSSSSSIPPPKKRRRPKQSPPSDSSGSSMKETLSGGIVGVGNDKPKRARQAGSMDIAAVSTMGSSSNVSNASSNSASSSSGAGEVSGTSTYNTSIQPQPQQQHAPSLMRYMQSQAQAPTPAAGTPAQATPPPPPASIFTAAAAQNPALATMLSTNPALVSAALASAQQLLTTQQPQPQPQSQPQPQPQPQPQNQIAAAAALAALAGLNAAAAPAPNAPTVANSPLLAALTQQLSALIAPTLLQNAAAQQQAAAQNVLAGALQKLMMPGMPPAAMNQQQEPPQQQAQAKVQVQTMQQQPTPVAPKLSPMPVAPAPVARTMSLAPSQQQSQAAQDAHEVAAKALKQVQRKRVASSNPTSFTDAATVTKKSRKKAATATTSTSTKAAAGATKSGGGGRGRKRATPATANTTAVSSNAVVPKRIQHQPLVPTSVVAGAAPSSVSNVGTGHLHHHVRPGHPPASGLAPQSAEAAGHAAAMATPLLLPYMRKWKLEELEAHVKLLNDANRPIPQPLAVLLAEARRKEQRRSNKRAANRRSASTSRARKKALVEEMTKMNAKLRRQALILSLLPDMVLAINVDGEITFCSAQVERILQHKSDDLVGAELSQLLLPPSRAALRLLIDSLVAKEAEASAVDANNDVVHQRDGENDNNSERGEDARPDGANGPRRTRRAQENAEGEDGAVVVSEQSEQSFPLSVVNVKNRSKQAAANVEDVSDSSGGENNTSAKEKGDGNDSKGGTTSSLTNNSSLSRSTTNSSFGNDSKDAAAEDGGGDANKSERESVSTDRAVKSDHRHGSNSGRKESSSGKKASSPTSQTQQQQQKESSSGDDSSSSSNLRKASEALNRNVRWHNEKMMTSGKSEVPHGPGLTDDVTGASVTANNAGARLSSLQHLPSMVAEGPNNETAARENTEVTQVEEEGARIKKVTGKAKKAPVDRTSSTLTFESMEDAQSSSSDSLLSGVEEKEGRAKRGSNNSSRGRDGELSSEDSGYRESGESVPSREDTSSSASDDASTEEKGGSTRPKPLAPTCNVCVIRKDLSTVWCEVTSSIRTRSVDDSDGIEGTVSGGSGSGTKGSATETKTSGSESTSGDDQEKPPNELHHELLLCFRPIRDGEEMVGEELRFIPPEKAKLDDDDQEQASADRSNTENSRSTEGVSSLTQSADPSNTTSNNSEDATNTSGSSANKHETTRAPPKKRPLPQEGVVVSAESNNSATATSSTTASAGDGSGESAQKKRRRSLTPRPDEADVAESLVLMNKSPTNRQV